MNHKVPVVNIGLELYDSEDGRMKLSRKEVQFSQHFFFNRLSGKYLSVIASKAEEVDLPAGESIVEEEYVILYPYDHEANWNDFSQLDRLVRERKLSAKNHLDEIKDQVLRTRNQK